MLILAPWGPPGVFSGRTCVFDQLPGKGPVFENEKKCLEKIPGQAKLVIPGNKDIQRVRDSLCAHCSSTQLARAGHSFQRAPISSLM